MRKLTAISPVLLLQRIGYPKRDTTSKLRFASSRITLLRDSTTVSRWRGRAMSAARFLTSERSLKVLIQPCVSGRCKCFSNCLTEYSRSERQRHGHKGTDEKRGQTLPRKSSFPIDFNRWRCIDSRQTLREQFRRTK